MKRVKYLTIHDLRGLPNGEVIRIESEGSLVNGNYDDVKEKLIELLGNDVRCKGYTEVNGFSISQGNTKWFSLSKV